MGSGDPVPEDAPLQPISPYGLPKLMVDWMFQDAAFAGLLDYVALRYFNVAGADPHQRTRQSTPNATHLIKGACQAALGRIEALDILGSDYPTPDGTGIRDYIHVTDPGNAHLLALESARSRTAGGVFNVGYGRSRSVRELSLQWNMRLRARCQHGTRPDVCGGCGRDGGRRFPIAKSAGIVGSAYIWESRLNA